VDLGYRLTERVVASVLMPEGYGVGRKALDMADDNAFTRVEQRYVTADGALWLRRERVQKEAYVRPDQYHSLRSTWESVWDNLDQSTPVVKGGERGREYGQDPF
jgi:hypothetical protein